MVFMVLYFLDVAPNDNGQIWARIEKRKRRHLGRIGNIKKVQNHEYHVPEESREEMDMEKPNGVSKAEIDYILTNSHRCNNHQPSQHWK